MGWGVSSPQQTPETRASLATDYGRRFFLYQIHDAHGRESQRL